MLGRRKSVTMNFVVFLGICCVLVPTSWIAVGLSDKRLCADPKCQEIISLGTAKIRYTSSEAGVLSFNINSPIRIKSKSAGSDPNLWGVEINGREGYAPKNFIMETKIFIKEQNLKHYVPVVLPGQKAVETPKVPTLAASETESDVKADVELTTTAPLLTPSQSQGVEGPVIAASTDTVDQKPENATPVQMRSEIIDGTEIPVFSESNIFQNIEAEKEVAKGSEEFDEEGILDAADEDLEEDEENEDEEDGEKLSDESKEDINRNTEHGKSENDSIAEVSNTKDNVKHVKQAEQAEVTTGSTANIMPLSVADVPSNSQEDKQIADHLEVDTPKTVKTDQTNVEDANVLNDLKPLKNIETEADQKENSNKQDKNAFETSNNVSSNKAEENFVLLKNNLDDVQNNKTKIDINEETNENLVLSNINKDNMQNTEAKSNIEDNVANIQNDTKTETLEEKLEEELDKTSTEKGDQYEAEKSQNETVKEQEQSNETTMKSFGETVTTEPTVTESGYLHDIDPRDLNIFDTTTIPTPQAGHEQTLESKDSSTPDTTTTPVIEGSSSIVPTVQSKIQSDLSDVPNASEKDPAQENVPLNTHADLQFAPRIRDTPLLEKTVNDIDRSTEKLSPPLPLFQQTTIDEENINSQSYDHQYEQGGQQRNEETTTNTYLPESTEELIQLSNNNIENDVFINQQDHRREETQQAEPEPIKEETLLTSIPMKEDPQHTFHSPETSTVGNNLEKDDKVVGVGSFEKVQSLKSHAESEPVTLPGQTPPAIHDPQDGNVKDKGLFATILGTVNSFLSNEKKETINSEDFHDEELQRILFPDRVAPNKKPERGEQYCEKLLPNDCPLQKTSGIQHEKIQHSSKNECHFDLTNISLDMLLTVAANKMFEMSELLACLAIAAATSLFFLFVYYCFCNTSREGALLSRLNVLERSLLATQKENAILKQDLLSTRSKLSSIEDNSFGSNDMVISLKKELEEEIVEKQQLQEQVANLEKELENAAEAGLELNKIVSELLNNQSGDESIISSVEELQRQLNEQQKTILDINANLAEKSRENSELQLMIAEQNARLSGEIASLQQDNDELETEKSNLQTRLEEIKHEFEEDITKALEGKNYEIRRLQSEIVELNTKWESEHTKLQTSLAKVEALEECLRAVRRDPSVNINKVIDVANARAELLDMQKKCSALKERLDMETDGRKLAEEHVKVANDDIEKLKQDFNQSEKDKLEAQTRLEVLSNYFKEKENQLQKELSLKEAMWLKQQGETTSTVDRLTTMQEEIQSLKSQNDALRAEIEAQLAAHKAQTGTLENRAHESWLAAKQSERRCEEARAEATALRRKLTALAGGEGVNFDKMGSNDLNNAPSPIHMEPAGSPLLSRLPPPPPFLPPPFMGPPPPFMAMPPPFVQPGEMRPPPLGRLMSPPPGAGSGGSGNSSHLPPRPGLYSPTHMDYDDYDDEEDDDDDDEEDYNDDENVRHRRRRRTDTNGSWDRDDSYSPPRAYRSHSPEDSRYNYTAERERDLISTYDTETDFSPPPSPRERRTRVSRAGSYKAYSPPPSASSPINAGNNSGSKKVSSSAISKGHASSESEKSYNVPRHSKKSGKSAV